MTAKDKKLLTIAAAVLIVIAIIVIGIKPTFTSFQEANAKKAELKAQKVQMQTEIEKLPSYQAAYDQAVSQYDATAKRVYGDLNNAGVQDAAVNELANSCGLVTTSFVITNVTNTNIAPYVVKPDETGKKVGVGMTSVADASVRVADVSITVFGAQDQIVNLLDKMNADEGISVRQVSYTPSPEGTSASISLLMILSETY